MLGLMWYIQVPNSRHISTPSASHTDSSHCFACRTIFRWCRKHILRSRCEEGLNREIFNCRPFAVMLHSSVGLHFFWALRLVALTLSLVASRTVYTLSGAGAAGDDSSSAFGDTGTLMRVAAKCSCFAVKTCFKAKSCDVMHYIYHELGNVWLGTFQSWY